MFIVEMISKVVNAGTDQLVAWVTQILPQVFLFLIFLNAVTRLIGRTRVEQLAARCGSNALLRYLVLPFLSAVVLGNPMAISMGRYLPEEYKPAYFASASYHCHTNSGIFQHINPAELFVWLGIANGVLSRGLDIYPLALRYLLAGLAANFLSGYVTELLTLKLENRQHTHLSRSVRLDAAEGSVPAASGLPGDDPENPAVNPPSSCFSGDKFSAVSTQSVSPFHTITITRGDGGYGGPLTITPTQERHTVLYMTAAGAEPEPLSRILALSGMTAVNGNTDTIPDEEVALAIIDCGGTLRCGIYPGKGIPTVNLLATGRSGPLAKYITEDLYVSAVTSDQVSAAEIPAAESSGAVVPSTGLPADLPEQNSSPGQTHHSGRMFHSGQAACTAQDTVGLAQDQALAHEAPENTLRSAAVSVIAVSKVLSIFHQSARDAVHTCIETLLPFMGFAALFVGICRGSGLTPFLAELMKPMGSSLPGLFLIGFLCSLPGLSAVLGAGAITAQMLAALIGDLIASGSISPAMALPALFAVNCQCACDFIPVGLGMMEAESETMQLGVSAVTLSRFLTGWFRILIALLFSFGLYAA